MRVRLTQIDGKLPPEEQEMTTEIEKLPRLIRARCSCTCQGNNRCRVS